nr:peptidoglycan-recognition protein 2 [Onthophagus taurus]
MHFQSVIILVVLCGVFESNQSRPDCPRILYKADWGGRAAKGVEHTIIPVKYVIIHHTVTPSCSTEEICSDLVTNIQNYHMDELNWHDIGYNFLIGGDGNVYEGAGWHRIGAHTYGYNSKSLGLAFIGTYTSKLPNEKQLEAAKKLISCGVEKGELAQKYKLLGGRTVSATQSPGLKLFQEIKNWKGFTINP